MSRVMRKQIYAMHHLVPIKILHQGWDLRPPNESCIVLRINFVHPCPCEDWHVDTKREFSYFNMIPLSDIKYMQGIDNSGDVYRFLFKEAKREMRGEAAKHVDEFYATGTMDGVRVKS